jgi:hypothetical protein
VEAPLIPVYKEPVPKRGGLLSRIFCTGLISGTNGPLEPVLISIFRLVVVHAPMRVHRLDPVPPTVYRRVVHRAGEEIVLRGLSRIDPPETNK